MLISKIRNSRFAKVLAAYASLTLFSDMIFPTMAYALTGGPSQPEVESFTPVGVSDLVDVSSGNFKYNIPLMDVGGYPVNLFYNSGVSVNQEASMVGLGWNINAGAITRNMRGLPDDFSGDKVKKEIYMKPNRTFGVTISPNMELFNLETKGLLKKLGKFLKVEGSFTLGINYNTYNGVGITQGVSFNASAGPLSGSLGMHASDEEGLTLSPGLSFSGAVQGKKKVYDIGSNKVGLSINSRSGLSSMTFATSQRLGKKRRLSVDPSISFATNTYVPIVQNPMENYNFTFRLQGGISLFGGDLAGDLGANYSSQELANEVESFPAYGYQFMEKGGRGRVLKDFNREKDAAFHEGMTHLPLTNQTYDSYTIAGHGVGGSFRPHRTQFGHVSDTWASTFSTSGNASVEIEALGVADIGADFKMADTRNTYGTWKNKNSAYSSVRYTKPTGENESFYFKQTGEMMPDEGALFANIGGYDAARFPLDKSGKWDTRLKQELDFDKTGVTGHAISSSNMRRQERPKRSQLVTALTAREVEMRDGPFTGDDVPKSYIKSHHTSEITVTQTDGTRYVYGMPVYNTQQNEVTFNVSKQGSFPIIDCDNGTVQYSHGSDNKRKNGNGKDEYYSRTELPAYAHSYMLTAVYSPDYVDKGEAGPSAEDLGTAVEFEYMNVDDYGWRTPYGYQKASFNDGVKSQMEDDMGSYIYGKKDLRYLKKIKTRTHVAVFEYGDRADGRSSNGEAGGLGSVKMKYLKSITLWDTKNYYLKVNNKGNAVPTKRVYFEYDYTLCKGVENNVTNHTGQGDGTDSWISFNQGGKLTLKEVYFYYQNSTKAKFNGYKFNYNADAPGEYSYSLKANDVWGNYKPDPSSTYSSYCQNPLGPLTNSEYPYVNQQGVAADYAAKKWSLSSIELPSGGKIEVDYEADDYAYVQDRQAMQMFKIFASSNGNLPTSPLNNNANQLYPLYEVTGGSTSNFNYLYFRLEDQGSHVTDSWVRANYWGDIKKRYDNQIQFQFYVKLQGSNYEYIKGYVEAEDMGVTTISGTSEKCGWIKMKPATFKEDGQGQDINPITKAAWSFTKAYNQELAFGNADKFKNPSDSDGRIIETLKALGQPHMLEKIIEFILGPFRVMWANKQSSSFVANKSWVRLMNVNGKKKGGGHRVSTIKIHDNWDKMVGSDDVNDDAGENFTYGQRYFYDMNGDGTGKSSGVASYEPEHSNENPFKQPVFITKEVKGAHDITTFVEEPFGESFYPSANVVYRKVTIQNLNKGTVDEGGTSYTLFKNGTGKQVSEFYTAYDYPTITNDYALDSERKSLFSDFSIISAFSKDYVTATQGYVVVNNDMHGKPKAEWVYQEGKDDITKDAPISGVEYRYEYTPEVPNTTDKFSLPPAVRTGLNNQVTVIDKEGNTSEKWVGVEYDAVADFRESETEVVTQGAAPGLSSFLFGIIFGVIPGALPIYGYENTRFRTAVVTKVVQQNGILREVVAHDNGAQIATRNKAWDAETGEVLLTETLNEYGDKIFNFNYPAYWKYDKMGMAYQNEGMLLKTEVDNAGLVENNIHLTLGDEVLVYNAETREAELAWVWGDNANMDEVVLIDRSGAAINGDDLADGASDLMIKILRSGRRNMHTSSMGSVTTKVNPIATGKLKFDQNTQVLAAQSAEYSDEWKTLWQTIKKEEVIEEDDDCHCEINSVQALNIDNLLSLIYTQRIDQSKNVKIIDDLEVADSPHEQWYKQYLSSSGIKDYQQVYFSGNYDPTSDSYKASFEGQSPAIPGLPESRKIHITLYYEKNLNGGFPTNGWAFHSEYALLPADKVQDVHWDIKDCEARVSILLDIPPPAPMAPGASEGIVTRPPSTWAMVRLDVDDSDWNWLDCHNNVACICLPGDDYYPLMEIFKLLNNQTLRVKENESHEFTSGDYFDKKDIYDRIVSLKGFENETPGQSAFYHMHFPVGDPQRVDAVFRYGSAASCTLTLSHPTYDIQRLFGGTEAARHWFTNLHLDENACTGSGIKMDVQFASGKRVVDEMKSPSSSNMVASPPLPVEEVFELDVTTDCMDLYNCTPKEEEPPTEDPCPTLATTIINPFVAGMRGNWRPNKSYAFLNERDQTFNWGATNIAGNAQLNVRTDGHYSAFSPYWTYNTGTKVWDSPSPLNNPWTSASEVINHHPKAPEVENRDALEIFSSVQMGYRDQLAVAVSANARYRDIGYDGFEDYKMTETEANCVPRHFAFDQFKDWVRDIGTAHTGQYALKLPRNGAPISMLRTISTDHCIPYSIVGADVPYVLKECDNLGVFGPYSDLTKSERFVMSYWVRVMDKEQDTDYSKYVKAPEVYVGGQDVVIAGSLQRSAVIDGWQRYECEFEIPAAASGGIQLDFASVPGKQVYLDDLRVHPFNSTLVTYVYDNRTYRLIAELDHNNFATLYEYDEEGILQRVKKETERGVMTIKETRNNNSKGVTQ